MTRPLVIALLLVVATLTFVSARRLTDETDMAVAADKFAAKKTLKRGSLQHDPTQFKQFLIKNVLPSTMPRSFQVYPDNYFSKVPQSQRPNHYTTPKYIVQCNNVSVSAKRMNEYMFQTEEFLTALGLNIYDGAMWCLALSLLGETDTCMNYLTNTIVAHKTVQFPDIRGDRPCAGITEYNQCQDPEQAGACGFCYGNGQGNAAKTLSVNNAYFFRLISDYWAIDGTLDARCPDQNKEWIWNDYKPILGENAWCQLLGPANVAMVRYKNDPTQIPDSDPLFALGIPFLSALQKMKVGTIGAFYYTPYNTWFGFNAVAQNIGSTFSTENQGSLLAGLEAMHFILNKNPASQYVSFLPQIARYITDLKKYLVMAFDKTKGYFRQGGTYNAKTNTITWGQNNQPAFAVDCQTWVSSVLGTKFIDQNFGPRTAFKLWQTVKARANWTCPSGGLCGVGYTDNTISGQVFSGEWTYGAINWLKVMVADSGYDSSNIASLQADIGAMYFGLETYLYDAAPIDNSTDSYNSVKYADRRYWIPFGWYANPIPAASSTAWAVAVASNYNPFNVDKGKYTKSYGN